jgi:hypothetical protein
VFVILSKYSFYDRFKVLYPCMYNLHISRFIFLSYEIILIAIMPAVIESRYRNFLSHCPEKQKESPRCALLCSAGIESNPRLPCSLLTAATPQPYLVGSSDFDIFLEIQHASCVFGLALKS